MPRSAQAILERKIHRTKIKEKFSCIADDNAHEQNNKLIRDDGGAIGILNSPKALMRWMVAEPEVARMLSEYNESAKNNSDFRSHRDQLRKCTRRKSLFSPLILVRF